MTYRAAAAPFTRDEPVFARFVATFATGINR
jgi:hypothetical protein